MSCVDLGPSPPRDRRPARTAGAAAAFLALALAALPVGEGAARAGCIPARQVFAVREGGGVPFRQPSDLVLAGNRLLVLDDLNGRVALLDTRGNAVGSLRLPGEPGSSWLGIGFGGADQIFLAGSSEGRIVVLDLAGKQVREFIAAEGTAAARPAGVLLFRGRCFVADNAAHRIRVYSLDGKLEAAWGGPGEGPQQFRAPFRIAADSLDRILVSDALNGRVLVFTPKGDPLLAIGEFGTSEGTLYRPAGIAVLEDDRVLVSDNYFGSLQIFGARGEYLGVLCGAEGRPLALENPVAVAARGSTVFVLEMGAGRVSAFEIGRR